MATILPKKTGFEQPMALDDDHHDALASDPTIHQFPQGSSFGDKNGITNSTISQSTFGSTPSAGFSSGSSFASPASTSSSNGNFGSGSTIQSGPTVSGSTAAGSNAAQGADVLVANDNTDWINKKWRPVMGWVYMLTCTCDFVLFPILWSLLQALTHGNVTSQWQPLTLQGAGLYHIAMGAVLGIAAYGRTKEKVAGAA